MNLSLQKTKNESLASNRFKKYSLKKDYLKNEDFTKRITAKQGKLPVLRNYRQSIKQLTPKMKLICHKSKNNYLKLFRYELFLMLC